jgi:hypothetical protein
MPIHCNDFHETHYYSMPLRGQLLRRIHYSWVITPCRVVSFSRASQKRAATTFMVTVLRSDGCFTTVRTFRNNKKPKLHTQTNYVQITFTECHPHPNYSFHNLLCSCLVSYNIYIQLHRTTNLPRVFSGCDAFVSH